MSEQKDLYEILGVSKNATEDEIKKAYKKKVKQYHPDLNPDSATAEEKMKEVNRAWDILSNPEKKARYDQFGDDGSQGAGFGGGAGGFGGFGGFGGIDDIFDMFTGGGFGRQRNPNAPRQGSDLRMNITVTFEEAAKGVTKEVELSRMEACPDCRGSGAKDGTSRSKCPHCGGSGQVTVNQSTPFGKFQTVKPCPRCNGAGVVIDTPCPSCKGSGRVKKSRTIKVNIPAGVDTDSRLRMAGEGEGGFNGGPPGDLYIYITVKQHEHFRRQGDDIISNITISMVQAALGAEIDIDTLDGKVKLTIPAGTQSGTAFRLKGRGFPKLRGYGKGDLQVRVAVATPTGLNDEQKELLRQFDAVYEEKRSTAGGKADGKAGKANKTEKSKGFFNKNKK
jgi:molecular chaperone DnaJ